MQTAPLKKNKINLSDYSYQKDIKLRLFMSELTVIEVNVLTEIVQGSLKIKISHLAAHLEIELPTLLQSLNKLEKTRLYQIENDSIVVNKEMRKYWENQIPKFSNDFRADMEFLRDLLYKVPIHVLPNWYSIPRSSDDIFISIIEKYFLTPKIYRRYLNELHFDEPILNEIMKDVFNAPDYKIHAQTLIHKYALSREKFEEFMLQLEFNFVCCLSYNQSETLWQEVITPFHEWRQYLRHKRDQAPGLIEDKTKITRDHTNDFGFVQDINRLLQHLTKEPAPLSQNENKFYLNDTLQNALFPEHRNAANSHTIISKIIHRALNLQLVKLDGNLLKIGPGRLEWEEKHLHEQAITVYRSAVAENNSTSGGYIDKYLKETEVALKKIVPKGWIYFEDFVKACTAPIGENEPVMLKKTGRRWKYQLPEYKEQDIAQLRQYIFDTLFQAGITATGSHEGKPCFYLTPFGRMTLD